uniref:C-type lectin domain-containing protein n=1 Tax=Acrobeloides nanus TaxID=290746 RepID=A0A914BYL8_9BILA
MKFIANISEISDYPFYLGLHKNKNSQWVWYDYDLTEFPLSGYSDWAPGYPDSNPSDGCAIITSDDGINLSWKTQACNSGLLHIVCQARACDAANLYCCEYCNEMMEGGLMAERFHERRHALQAKTRQIKKKRF